MKRALLYAAVAAALGSAGAAQAAATQVNFGFVPVGNFSYLGTSLGTSTALDFGAATFSVNTVGQTFPYADDSGAFLGMSVFLSKSVLTYTIGQTVDFDLTKTFITGEEDSEDSAAGPYTAVFTSVTAGSAGDDFVNLTFVGSIEGPNGFSASDVMLLNCNQSGGGGGGGLSVNCSFTEQGPPVPTQVPEPASLALVGLALVGMSVARRRRS